jgi:hypothetical protein
MNHNDINKHDVRIHIDREIYESPNPTTGAALYKLGQIPADIELLRSAEGDLEDELIPNDVTEVHLKPNDHFYSHNDFMIIVNAQQKYVTKKKISFDMIVALAFPNPPSGPNIRFTITYRNGPLRNPEGTLVEGATIKVKGGMIFNVTATDKS